MAQAVRREVQTICLEDAEEPLLHAIRHLDAAEEWLSQRKRHNAQDLNTAILDAIIGVGWTLVALGSEKVKSH